MATRRSPTPCRIRAAADDRNRPDPSVRGLGSARLLCSRARVGRDIAKATTRSRAQTRSSPNAGRRLASGGVAVGICRALPTHGGKGRAGRLETPPAGHRYVAIATARRERARASKRSLRWLRRPIAVVVAVRSSDQLRASWGARGRAGPEPAYQPPGCRRLLISTCSASVNRAHAFQSRSAAKAELWSRGQSPCVARAHPLDRRRGRRAVAAVTPTCSAVGS
jgi:hypothetical protein